MLKQYITSVQNSSGSVTSTAILMVGFFPLEKKNYMKLEACVCVRVSMGTHLTGGMQRVVEARELSCSVRFTV